jgi:hypothetical protein
MNPEQPQPAVTFGVLDAVPAAVRAQVEPLARSMLQAIEAADDDSDTEAPIRSYSTATARSAPQVGPLPKATGVPNVSGNMKGVSRASVIRTLDGHTEGMAGTGWGTKGKWTEAGIASGPVPKSAVRDLQLANQVSEAIIAALDLNGVKTTEIEVMLVNNRMLVSANEAAVVATLTGTNLRALFATIATHLEEDSLAEYAERKAEKVMAVYAALIGRDDDQSTGTRRLADIAVCAHLLPDQVDTVRAALGSLPNGNQPFVDGGRPPEAAALITNPAYIGRIIAVKPNVVDGEPKSHAEQNLALALVLSGYTGPVAIAGGKRPCTICYLSLCLVRHRKAPSLRFNEHPGGFWEGTTSNGLHHIVQALKLSLVDMAADMALFPVVNQYVTDLNVHAPVATAVDGLVDAVRRRQVITNTGSPSQSPQYHWFDEGNDDMQVETKTDNS